MESAPNAKQCSLSASTASVCPSWVENPDGSVQVLLPDQPAGASAGGASRQLPGARIDNNTFPKTFESDAIEEMPYYDYELPPLPDVPLFPQPYGGQGITPAGAAVASVGRSADDEAFVRRCRQRDAEVAAAVAAGDAPVIAAIQKADRSRAGQGDGNPDRRAPPSH